MTSLPLAYSVSQEEGRAVVFVHGFSHNRSVWSQLVSSMSPGLRCFCVDLRGHGASPWSPEADYGLSSYAEDLLRFLEDRHLDRVDLVGHSLGGNVATLFAAAHPERVRSLVLVDTGPSLDLGGVLHIAGEVGATLRTYPSIAAFREQLAALHPLADADSLDALAAAALRLRLDGRYEPAIYPGVLGATGASSELALLERELWVALRSLRCPVLLVRGGLSSVLSEKVAREIQSEALHDGRLLTLRAAGHAVMLDDVHGLTSALRSFLLPPQTF